MMSHSTRCRVYMYACPADASMHATSGLAVSKVLGVTEREGNQVRTPETYALWPLCSLAIAPLS